MSSESRQIAHSRTSGNQSPIHEAQTDNRMNRGEAALKSPPLLLEICRKTYVLDRQVIEILTIARRYELRGIAASAASVEGDCTNATHFMHPHERTSRPPSKARRYEASFRIIRTGESPHGFHGKNMQNMSPPQREKTRPDRRPRSRAQPLLTAPPITHYASRSRRRGRRSKRARASGADPHAKGRLRARGPSSGEAHTRPGFSHTGESRAAASSPPRRIAALRRAC